jgi:hypothetical protein
VLVDVVEQQFHPAAVWEEMKGQDDVVSGGEKRGGAHLNCTVMFKLAMVGACCFER